MAKRYRFFNESFAADVLYVTDGFLDHETFFLTEKRNEGSVEVKQGLNIQVKEYTDTYLRNLAKDTALSLSVYDEDVLIETVNGDASLLTYSMAEQESEAVVNYETKTIDITVVNATDPSALVATFTLSTDATATIGATPQVSGTTSNDFSSPVTYSIESDLGTVVDWTVAVTVADA